MIRALQNLLHASSFIVLALLVMKCGSNSQFADLVTNTTPEATDESVVVEGLIQATNVTTLVNLNDGATPTIAFDAQTSIDTDAYSHDIATDNDEITVLANGNYKITYNINFSSNYSNRVVMKGMILINDAEIFPSQSYCYIRHTAYGVYCGVSASVVRSLNSGDTISVAIDGATGSAFGSSVNIDVMRNETWVMVERLNVITSSN